MYMLRARKTFHGVPSLPPPQLSGSGPTSGAQSSKRNRSKYFGVSTFVLTSVCNADSRFGPTPEGAVPAVVHIETGET